MKYSLISRDWVADCVEIMHEAYFGVSKNNNNNTCYRLMDGLKKRLTGLLYNEYETLFSISMIKVSYKVLVW